MNFWNCHLQLIPLQLRDSGVYQQKLHIDIEFCWKTQWIHSVQHLFSHSDRVTVLHLRDQVPEYSMWEKVMYTWVHDDLSEYPFQLCHFLLGVTEFTDLANACNFWTSAVTESFADLTVCNWDCSCDTTVIKSNHFCSKHATTNSSNTFVVCDRRQLLH